MQTNEILRAAIGYLPEAYAECAPVISAVYHPTRSADHPAASNLTECDQLLSGNPRIVESAVRTEIARLRNSGTIPPPASTRASAQNPPVVTPSDEHCIRDWRVAFLEAFPNATLVNNPRLDNLNPRARDEFCQKIASYRRSFHRNQCDAVIDTGLDSPQAIGARNTRHNARVLSCACDQHIRRAGSDTSDLNGDIYGAGPVAGGCPPSLALTFQTDGAGSNADSASSTDGRSGAAR